MMRSLGRTLLGDKVANAVRKKIPSTVVTNTPAFFRYLENRRSFKKFGGRIDSSHVILHDFNDVAGETKGHYFHQDLLVASFIATRGPARHIDVGSRIDGFVAHVASFREIEILDVRKLGEIGHPQIKFVQRDLMKSDSHFNEITDSLSCLHTIEHFGLGRYGDPIDPDGHKVGLQNLVDMLKPEGTLYLSFPIGSRNEVHFNAHRVFHPTDILSWPLNNASLALERFDYVDDHGNLYQDRKLDGKLPHFEYGCGIYTFRKITK